MADTAAALVIQLSADFNQFKREMKAATGVFDAEGRKIEQRQAKLRKNIETSFGSMGRFLSAVAVVGFARSILNMADALADSAAQLGITTQELQGLDYAARVSGASSEKLAQALSFLSDGLGEAQRGEGAMAKAMRDSGIQMGTTIEVLFDVADKVKAARTETEKMNIATTYLGARGGKLMVSFLNQGADGLKRLQEEAAKKGQIWDAATLAKLDEAKDSFETLKSAFVTVAALPVSAFMSQLAKVLELLADGRVGAAFEKFINSGALQGATVGAAAGSPLGLPGMVGGGLVGAVGGDALYSGPRVTNNSEAVPAEGWKLVNGKRVPLSSLAAAASKTPSDRTAVPKAPSDMAKDLKDAARAAEILTAAQEDAQQGIADYQEAVRDTARVANDALITQAQGWSNYAEIQQSYIADIARLDAESIQDRLEADLAALDARERADLEHLGELGQYAQKAAQVEAAYEQQRVSRRAQTAEQLKAIEAQAAADTAQIQTNSIKLTDAARDGLMDIGTAALHGFGSMKDAAAGALEQIAQMILQMYVLKPLVESLLGPSGGGGGGFLGSLISSIPGFANGTNSAPGGLAMVGERGPELVKLPRGSQVIPNAQIGRSVGGGSSRVDFNIHVTGTTDAEIMEQVRTAVHAGIAAYDRQALPTRVAELRNDPRRR